MKFTSSCFSRVCTRPFQLTLRRLGRCRARCAGLLPLSPTLLGHVQLPLDVAGMADPACSLLQNIAYGLLRLRRGLRSTALLGRRRAQLGCRWARSPLEGGLLPASVQMRAILVLLAPSANVQKLRTSTLDANAMRQRVRDYCSASTVVTKRGCGLSTRGYRRGCGGEGLNRESPGLW